jgi:plasmid stabilization system protein ParE
MSEAAAKNEPPAELPPPKKADRSKNFAFDHAVFQVKGAYFGFGKDGDNVCLHVPLGDIMAALPLDAVLIQFKIDKDSEDAKLLDVVQKSMKYVKRIEPGDSIPAEILDGTASWRVEPHHVARANARISVSILSWMSGKPVEFGEIHELENMANSPDTKKKVQEAFELLAEKLGLGRANKNQIVDKIEQLAKESAYIEALRERFAEIQKLAAGFNVLHMAYKRERGVQEEIGRIRILMKKPVEDIANILLQVDANTGEVFNVLKRLPEVISYIREKRDEMHQRFMLWDDILPAWKNVPMERDGRVDRLVRTTYRFVARHFPQDSEWSLMR